MLAYSWFVFDVLNFFEADVLFNTFLPLVYSSCFYHLDFIVHLKVMNFRVLYISWHYLKRNPVLWSFHCSSHHSSQIMHFMSMINNHLQDKDYSGTLRKDLISRIFRVLYEMNKTFEFGAFTISFYVGEELEDISHTFQISVSRFRNVL